MSKIYSGNISFLLILFCSCFLSQEKAMAQSGIPDSSIVITDTTNIEGLYRKARELSYERNYSQAAKICLKILERKPNYFDVRTFLARTYAWDKQYDKARTELSKVLIEKENDYEALNALFDVEYWTESYSSAGYYLNIALGFYPTSEDLLLKKVKLQLKLEEKSEAALTLRRILNLNSGNKEAVKLMKGLKGGQLYNDLKLGMLVDLFDKNDPQQLYSMEYGRNFVFGSLLFRTNYAQKFKKTGYQFELESYLRISQKTYLNLLAGRSEATIFPGQNYNGEIYIKLPRGFETSLGIRYQKWTTATKSYTLSVSNYYKDYWIGIRTFVNPKNDFIDPSININNSSITLIANFRIYYGDSDNYLGFKAGRGRSPDENKTLDITVFNQSTQGSIELQKRAIKQWLIKLDVTYAQDDQVRSKITKRISTNISLKTVF